MNIERATFVSRMIVLAGIVVHAGSTWTYGQASGPIEIAFTMGGGPGTFALDPNDPTNLLMDLNLGLVTSASGPGIDPNDPIVGVQLFQFALEFESDPLLGITTAKSHSWTIWEVSWSHSTNAAGAVTTTDGIMTMQATTWDLVAEEITQDPPTGSPFIDLMIELTRPDDFTFVETTTAQFNLNDGSGTMTTTLVATPNSAVPTVSEWGLIIMTVLGLTAGTVLFGRRRRAVAA